MDIDKLVELVTKEVMNRLNQSIISKEEVKEKVLVIANSEEEFKNISVLVAHKYELHLYNDENFNPNIFDKIILTGICNNLLSSLALGLCKGKKDSLVMDFLLKGKKVCVMEEGIVYRRYKNNSNKALFNLYKAYEDKIISYGVDITNENELLKALLSNEDERILEKPSMSHTEEKLASSSLELNENAVVPNVINKRLISESDIKKIYMNGVKEISIAKKSILTPLAQDFIRIHHLKVNKIG